MTDYNKLSAYALLHESGVLRMKIPVKRQMTKEQIKNMQLFLQRKDARELFEEFLKDNKQLTNNNQ